MIKYRLINKLKELLNRDYEIESNIEMDIENRILQELNMNNGLFLYIEDDQRDEWI